MDTDEAWIVVEGRSMSPALHPGDSVAVCWSGPTGPMRPSQPGELVLVRDANGECVVHRVTGSGRIKGDASPVSERLEPARVLGHVIGLRKKGALRGAPYRTTGLDRLIADLSARSETSPAAGVGGRSRGARTARGATVLTAMLRRFLA